MFGTFVVECDVYIWRLHLVSSCKLQLPSILFILEVLIASLLYMLIIHFNVGGVVSAFDNSGLIDAPIWGIHFLTVRR